MTALFFGSFNPVHIGHLIIAEYFARELGETWMVLSPHNPLKPRDMLANDYDRLALLELGIGNHESIRSSNIEFALPKPSYTVDTLTVLRDRFPDREFAIILGSDNLISFHKWKNPEEILRHHQLHIYARPDYVVPEQWAGHPKIKLHSDVPQMHLSSSYIRKLRSQGHSIRYLVPDAVRLEIEAKGLYR